MKSPSPPVVCVYEVRVLPIDCLKPAPYNPRKVLKPTDKAYQRLEASLREFGLVEPLIWNERTGCIVGGHARLAILKAMGIREVSVSVVNLSDTREKALNVVLNNQEAQSRYDPTKLTDLLVKLDGMAALPLTGFDSIAFKLLQMAPLPARARQPSPTGRVTVTLEMTDAVYAQAEPKVDALIKAYEVTSHVTRR